MSAVVKISMPRRAFVAPITTPNRRANICLNATTYKVTFVNREGQEKTIDCRDDDYLLDAADAGGVDLPANCRGGVCGSCVSKLVAGDVDQSWLCELDDGNVLTREQMAAGFILPCSAMPKSDLKIEYSNDWGYALGKGEDAVIECLVKSGANLTLPWSTDYNVQRQVFSKLYLNLPLAVAHPETEEQVAAVLKCGLDHNVKVTARSGAHGNAGQSVVNGGITLDLGRFTDFKISDDLNTITFGPGLSMGKIAYYTAINSNGTHSIPIGNKASVGTGLILGGGIGYSTRYQGLTCDLLLSIRAVLPTGEVIEANAEKNQDLFSACCGGGGGNVPIIVEFSMKTFAISQRVSVFTYPIIMTASNISKVAEIINFYQDWSLSIDNKTTPNLLFQGWVPPAANGTATATLTATGSSSNTTLPSKMVVFGWYLGPKDQFIAALTDSGLNETTPLALSKFQIDETDTTGGILRLVNAGTTDPEYLAGDEAFMRNYNKYKSLLLIDPLSPEGINMLLGATSSSVSQGWTFAFKALGGANSAFSAVPADATAFSHRNARHLLLFNVAQPTDEAFLAAMGELSRVYYELGNFVNSTAKYINLLDTDVWNYQESYYGLHDSSNGEIRNATFTEMLEVRAKYDPTNMLSGVQPVVIPGTVLMDVSKQENTKPAVVSAGIRTYSLLASVLFGALVTFEALLL